MADPEAAKPDDWDEDAPLEVEDEEAEKPEGWLDDEPDEIDDPGVRPVVQASMLPTSLRRSYTRPICLAARKLSVASPAKQLPFLQKPLLLSSLSRAVHPR